MVFGVVSGAMARNLPPAKAPVRYAVDHQPRTKDGSGFISVGAWKDQPTSSELAGDTWETPFTPVAAMEITIPEWEDSDRLAVREAYGTDAPAYVDGGTSPMHALQADDPSLADLAEKSGPKGQLRWGGADFEAPPGAYVSWANVDKGLPALARGRALHNTVAAGVNALGYLPNADEMLTTDGAGLVAAIGSKYDVQGGELNPEMKANVEMDPMEAKWQSVGVIMDAQGGTEQTPEDLKASRQVLKRYRKDAKPNTTPTREPSRNIDHPTLF